MMMMIHGRFTRKSSGCLLILLLVLQNDHPMTNNQKGPLLLRIAINYPPMYGVSKVQVPLFTN